MGKVSETGFVQSLVGSVSAPGRVSGTPHSPAGADFDQFSLMSQYLPGLCFHEIPKNRTSSGARQTGRADGVGWHSSCAPAQAQGLCSINRCKVYIWCSSSLVLSSGNSFIMATAQVEKSSSVLPTWRLRPRGSESGRVEAGGWRSRG